MGGALCGRRRTAGSLAELGVPDEYQWEGIANDRLDAYYDEKEKLLEELQEKSEAELPDDMLFQHIPPQGRESLQRLLLRRAISLVHVLRPIEEQRRGMRWMQAQGAISSLQWQSYQRAEEICANELRSVSEEWRLMAPDAPGNGIIQMAVRFYRSHGLDWPNAPARPPEEQGRSFENVKRGFLANAKQKEPQLAHGLEIGSFVEAHSLQTGSLNGARGCVKGARADRVVVTFPPPTGEKALKPANLRPVAPAPDAGKPNAAPTVHPNAKEMPVVQFQMGFQPKAGESLGLTFSHDPPLEKQKPGQESSLVITAISTDGHVHKHNEGLRDPEQRLRVGDRLLGVVDGRPAEKDRKPVPGGSPAMLQLIEDTAVTPLIVCVGRVLGPPLRFKMGQRVQANCGQRGWLTGSVVRVWEDRACGGKNAYAIRLVDTWDVVTAPQDADEYVIKAPPRYKVGEQVMANRDGNGYRKGKILEVREQPITIAYRIHMMDGSGEWICPEELTHFVRAVARFTKGTKVLARVSDGYLPGVVEDVYHPNWVYSVRLDTGRNVVMAPEDADNFVKKR